MRSILKYFLLPCAVTLLFAEDPSWKTKPVAQWDEQDAKQVLVNSPWIKYTRPAVLPEQSEALRRQGGVMGGGQNGMGLEALKELNPFGFSGQAKRDDSVLLAAVPVRWESASPVRLAEVKIGAPTWKDDDYYAIAVYNMPDLLDEKLHVSAASLKNKAVLKLGGKKELKPSRVVILPEGDSLAVVIYLFPRSEPITMDDTRIQLDAQIGRLNIAPYFDLVDMQLQGKLEL